MADLAVTIGIDMKELEKGLADAGRHIQNLAGSGGGADGDKPGGLGKLGKGINAMAGGGGGGKFTAIGALFGPEGAAIGAILDSISAIFDKIGELMDYAKRLRNLSVATGISTKALQDLEGMATATGVSLETLAHAVAEFNKRVGEARIKGSELNNILVKMGVGMEQITSGQFKAIDGMKALAKAYEAGTDEATLMYYGVKMFGSSFEQLLPMIKRGSAALTAYEAQTLHNSEIATNELDRFSDEWDWFWHTLKVGFLEFTGWFLLQWHLLFDAMKIGLIKDIAVFSPSAAGTAAAKYLSPSLSKEQREMELDAIKFGLSDKQKKEFDDAFKKATGGDGKKLSPLGLAEAGAASQLQQMGGGDIFGATAFLPLDRIADATEQTAINTTPKDEPPSRPTETPAR